MILPLFRSGTERLAEFQRRFVVTPRGHAAFSSRGDAYPVTALEAETWMARARDLIEQHKHAGCVGCTGYLGIVLALTLVPAIAGSLMTPDRLATMPWLSPIVGALTIMTMIGVLIAPTIGRALAWRRFERQLDEALERRIILQLESVTPYRRRNPLALIGLAYLLIFEVGLRLAEYLFDFRLSELIGVDHAEWFAAPMLALIGFALHLAARAVDWWQVQRN